MSPTELYRVAHAQPFQPFRLHLSSGAFYDIRHPELIIVGPRTTMIGIPSSHRDPPLADRLVSVDMLHVTHVETLELPSN